MKKVFKRLKSQKGMSGVLVALLLVIVGVGLVAGLNTALTDMKDDMVKDANTSVQNSLNNP
ncbi:hypothetical protein [Sulfurimonas microaerophilic]|uniref:hypothetical protein n=1 Tax=Sulfurimonas microaerophilic TaxID=3058392 RepID=UPI00271466B1|nr:hypothetical protein [Sulfurimonas sp. hsl 1-7]